MGMTYNGSRIQTSTPPTNTEVHRQSCPVKNFMIDIIMMPMRKFVNREHELKSLSDHYGLPGFSMTVVYGRRRVGKTELVRHFMQTHEGIYFQCDRRGTAANAISFRRIAAKHFGDIEPAAGSIGEVLDYIARRHRKRSKLVVAIDELPYLVEQDPAVTSEIQRAVDGTLSESNVHLILLGSSVGMMKRETLDSRSPLCGRRSGQVFVRPFGLREMAAMFPKMRAENLVRVYGAYGGVPFYLQFVNEKLSFYENLKRTIFNKSHVLYAEGEFLMREELPSYGTYVRVLDAIAAGATRVSEIASAAGVRTSDLPHYLDRLMELELVRRIRPVLEKRRGSRKSIYRITDPFLRFWFRYVLRHGTMLEYRNIETVLEDLDDSYDRFLGPAFEDVSREFLLFASVRGLLPVRIVEIGPQWGKVPGLPKGQNQYEIDHVAYDTVGGTLLLAESKWSRGVDPVSIERRLKALTDRVPEFSRWENVVLVGLAKSFDRRRTKTELLTFDLRQIVSLYRSSTKAGPE